MSFSRRLLPFEPSSPPNSLHVEKEQKEKAKGVKNKKEKRGMGRQGERGGDGTRMH